MSIPVPGSGSESVPTWVSPAQQDADRAASIESLLPQVDGVASVFPPAGAELSGMLSDGVRINDERVEVHIIADYGQPLQDTANGIDRAVHPMLGGRELQIVVDDILLPGESLPEPDGVQNFESAGEQKSSPASDPVRNEHRTAPAESTGDSSPAPAADGNDRATESDPKAGVTVTVAPESGTGVTITTDPQVEVHIDVPAGAESDTGIDDDRDTAEEHTPGV